MAHVSLVALTRTSVSNFHSRKHNGSLSARSEVSLPVSCLLQVIRGSTCEGHVPLRLSSLLLWGPLNPGLHHYNEREGEGVQSHTLWVWKDCLVSLAIGDKPKVRKKAPNYTLFVSYKWSFHTVNEEYTHNLRCILETYWPSIVVTSQYVEHPLHKSL